MTEPRIETERLILRPPVPADAAAIALHAGDLRVARMTSSIPHPYPPGAAEAMVEAVRAGRWRERLWAIEMDGSVIGCIGLKQASAELGYWIAPVAWNTGFASEAVEAMVAHLLETERLPALNAVAFTDNPASQRVLEKAGFRRTGTGIGHSVARGESAPTVLYRCETAGRAQPGTGTAA